MTGRKSGGALLAEGLVIVVSVLLALWADAWLASRQEAQLGAEQLTALARDFDQMSARVDSSLWAAERAITDGRTLIEQLTGPTPQMAVDSGRARLTSLTIYEVFSPSMGAYEALVASGSIERVENEELKRALSDFFGSFDDLRVSEGLLLRTQHEFMLSDVWAELAGVHRYNPEIGLGDPNADLRQTLTWSESDAFLNGLAHMLVRQLDARADYQYLRRSIDRIQSLLMEHR